MNLFKIKSVQSDSGDIHLNSSNADRFSVLILAIIFQCLVLIFTAKGVQLIFERNPVGFLMIVFFSIPGSAVIWFNYFKKTGPAWKIFINQTESRVEFTPPAFFDAALIKNSGKEKNSIPFQDIEAISVLSKTNGHSGLTFHLKSNREITGSFHIPLSQTRHLARRIAGLIGCNIRTIPDDDPIEAPPVEPVLDTGPECIKETSSFPFLHNYPALIFSCLALVCAFAKYLDPRPPVWFYLGVHFQVVISIGGIILFIKGHELMKTAWSKTRYIFFCLLSCFLFLSFYFPSRGLFPLLAGCSILLIPVILKLKSVLADEFLFSGKLKWFFVFTIAIAIASPLLWYGYSASRAIYGFFSLDRQDIAGIAFYEIAASRKVQKKPAAIVNESAIIHKIVEISQSSTSQKDPRRVQRDYLMRIKRNDNVSFFASIGMMTQKEGCILFSSGYGVWGWEFGGYDNPLIVEGLKNSLNLWKDMN